MCTFSTVNRGFSTMASSKKVIATTTDNRKYGYYGNSNTAAETGNTYISGTMIDSVEIPTAILGFSTVNSSKKVPSNDYSSDRQPEIAICRLIKLL